MPGFFLHVRDGVSFIPDPDGSCLLDVAAARAEAILCARGLMSQSIIRDGHPGTERCFEITDDEGNTVAMVPFREAIS